tara:strand:+ start:14323 stop:14898 length:576 start_codon:yes stop_codon:yes gene_type:complete
MYGEGACILAALQLATTGVHDIASLDCELYRLNLLVTADAAPWDPIATACITRDTTTDSTLCDKIPTVVVNNVPAYPLYNEGVGNRFIERQTGIQISSCNRWFATTPADPDQCKCEDVVALKTLGSPQRTRIISMHEKRTKAADAVRARRTRVIKVIERALAATTAKDPDQTQRARDMYSDTEEPVADLAP